MEKVSALMDGELGDGEAKGQIARLKLDAELKYGWESYHLIGDALRGETPLTSGFTRRMADCLAQEPTVLAPQRQAAPRKFPTFAVSVAASVAGVALVWVVMSTGGVPVGGQREQMALAPTVPPAATAPPVTAPPPVAVAPQAEISVPSEGQSNEYLLAHQGISPSTAMQGVAPYIRTVSDIGQAAPVPR